MPGSAGLQFAIAGLATCALWIWPAFAQEAEPDIVDLAYRYCINPDGDHRMTWQFAQEDGFTVLTGPKFDGRRAVGVHDNSVRVLTRTLEGTEVRVTTAATFISTPQQGTSYFRWCWVSASPMGRNNVTADLQSHLGNLGFRVDSVRLFSWIPRPDGRDEVIMRRRFLREGYALAREQGLRQVSLKYEGSAVFIGYGSPRGQETYREFDWGGPAPVPAP